MSYGSLLNVTDDYKVGNQRGSIYVYYCIVGSPIVLGRDHKGWKSK